MNKKAKPLKNTNSQPTFKQAKKTFDKKQPAPPLFSVWRIWRFYLLFTCLFLIIVLSIAIVTAKTLIHFGWL